MVCLIRSSILDFIFLVIRKLRILLASDVCVQGHLHLCKQACNLAIDEGWAVNLEGGFGYNTTRISKGLAVYDDIPVCLAVSYRCKTAGSIIYLLIVHIYPM